MLVEVTVAITQELDYDQALLRAMPTTFSIEDAYLMGFPLLVEGFATLRLARLTHQYTEINVVEGTILKDLLDPFPTLMLTICQLLMDSITGLNRFEEHPCLPYFDFEDVRTMS
jgi:hypothetical protein